MTLISKPTTITAIIIALTVVGGGVFFAMRGNTPALAEQATANVVKSKFSFGGASGWWQGATNETSMALFDDNGKMACFTSVEYKKGIVDVATELKNAESQIMGRGERYTVSSTGTQTLIMKTTEGSQQYELHQSSINVPVGAEKIKSGQELGYIQLSGGYIKVMGNCDTADQLPDTISALNAVKFDNTVQ